jgi:ABC-2 type transport system permease protein
MIIFNQCIKRIFKNKIRFVILLIMPIIFIAMFALQDERSLTIGIVDKDQSTLSKKLSESIKNMDKVKTISLKENQIYDTTTTYQTEYSIIIEPGFEENLIAGKKPEIKEFYIDEKEKIFYARSFVENYINNMVMLANGVGNDKSKFMSVLSKYENGKLSFKNESKTDGRIPKGRQAMGFLVQFMLYMSVITAGLLSEDKNSGIFFRVFYAPVTLKRYLTENISAFLIIGIIQVTVVFALIRIVFGLELGKNILNIYLLFCIFSLVCVSLGMWVVSLFKKPLVAYAAIFLAATPLVMLGGCYWPVNFMSDTMQKIAQFLPTTWVMSGVDKILYEGKNIFQIGLVVLVLLIFSGIFFGAGLLKKVDISK